MTAVSCWAVEISKTLDISKGVENNEVGISNRVCISKAFGI